jgi:pimeloyl-ACP methyl ester carboxylesterase
MPLILLLLAILLLPGSLNAANLAEEQRLSEQLAGPNIQGEAQWLMAGDVRFLAIFKKSDANEHLGGAVLLHDAGENANDPTVIGPLRRYLAQRGWDTLALQLPRPVDPLSATDRAETTALSIARLRVALRFLRDREIKPLVLVGHGLGAEMALAYLAANPDNNVSTLVAIGLAAGEGGEDDPVIRTIANLQRPMLDLYGDRDLPEVLATAQARRGAAKRHQQAAYRQDRAAGADHYFRGLQENLLQRIASWLRRIAMAEKADSP